MTKKLIREIKILPAYDKRNPDPKKNYGIHGCTMAFYLKGPKGVIQFILYTNWQLPHVEKEEFGDWGSPKWENHSRIFCKPMPADIGYHSPVPMFEGHEPVWPTKMRKTGDGPLDVKFDKIGKKPPGCPFFNGKPCYYDGSSLYAEKIFEVLVSGGDEALWKKLEEEYYARFESKKSKKGN